MAISDPYSRLTDFSSVREARQSDVDYLAGVLRYDDIRELAALEITPDEALLEGLMFSSPCFTGLDKDGWPALMVGAVPYAGLHAAIWLLGTDAIETQSIRFLRYSRPILEVFFDHYRHLFNYVHSKNTVHIRWLSWLGFEIQSDESFITPRGDEFYYFRKREE